MASESSPAHEEGRRKDCPGADWKGLKVFINGGQKSALWKRTYMCWDCRNGKCLLIAQVTPQRSLMDGPNPAQSWRMQAACNGVRENKVMALGTHLSWLLAYVIRQRICTPIFHPCQNTGREHGLWRKSNLCICIHLLSLSIDETRDVDCMIFSCMRALRKWKSSANLKELKNRKWGKTAMKILTCLRSQRNWFQTHKSRYGRGGEWSSLGFLFLTSLGFLF